MQDHIIDILTGCRLCESMSKEEIAQMLKATDSTVKTYRKDEIVFGDGDIPSKLYILIEGKIGISRITCSGNRILVTNISQQGDMFGEVYLFMEKKEYDLQAEVLAKSTLLELSATIFAQSSGEEFAYRNILFHNLLSIFAGKAFILSNKIRLLGSGSIREKIACYIIDCQDKNGLVHNHLTREDMADYLNVTRPSLSREFGNMTREGILKIDGKKIIILDQELLETYL